MLASGEASVVELDTMPLIFCRKAIASAYRPEKRAFALRYTAIRYPKPMKSTYARVTMEIALAVVERALSVLVQAHVQVAGDDI
jgi:hypothetical protein